MKQQKKTGKACLRCGECCKFVVLDIEKMPEDEKLWLSYHKGMYLYNNKLIILNPCRHLKRVNRQYMCDIHNTDKYPEMCRTGSCIKNSLEEGTLHRFVQDLRKENRRK